jgi:hypothetical protein
MRYGDQSLANGRGLHIIVKLNEFSKERYLSRVITSQSGRTERERLLKAVVKAIRYLMTQQEPGKESLDVVAFIVLALYQVHETIDVSVTAWEKRGYWLKADRYRMEWEWCQLYAKDLEQAAFDQDWGEIIPLLIKIGEHLQHIKMPQRDRIGTPWIGAWEAFQERISKQGKE